MLVAAAFICLVSAYVFSILIHDNYFVFWYAFGDFIVFSIEWIVKFLFTSLVVLLLIIAVYYSYQCYQCLTNKYFEGSSIWVLLTRCWKLPQHSYVLCRYEICDNFLIWYASLRTEMSHILCLEKLFLEYRYMPTFAWGYCGHIQTIIFALWGRFNCPHIRGERITLKLADGATLSYDIFHSNSEKRKDELIFFVAPGFANNSETDYIRTFMEYVTGQGYRCAVLNHLGTLPEIPVTSPRIFSFGNTDDLHASLTDYISKYPKSKVILFGYSLGGNLVAKYLGEDRERSSSIIAGFSICSLLDANKATIGSQDWRLHRYFYQYFLARTIKQILQRHRHVLLSDEVVARHQLDVNAIFSAMSLVRFDELYTRRIFKFDTLKDYYSWSSAINYLNGIKVPMIFINSLDDPLLSDMLQCPVREFAGCRRKVLAIELRYGGHLGFFENNYFISESITWLEKALIQLAEALYADNLQCEQITT